MFKQNHQLKRKFTTIVSVTIVVIIFLCGLSGYKLYKMQLSLIHTNMKAEAVRLEKTVSYAFDYSSYLLRHIEGQLLPNLADLNKMTTIIKQYKRTDDSKAIFSSTIFTWVNKDLQGIIVNNIGLLPRPIDLSKSALWQGVVKDHRQSLHHGLPSSGMISGQWVIPIILSVMNQHNQFLGGLVMGLDIGLITEKMEKAVTSPSMSFVLIDKRSKEIILNSRNDKYISKEYDAVLSIDDIDLKNQPSGVLSKYSFWGQKKPQSYYQSFSAYPYVIIVNYSNTRITEKLMSALFPQVSICGSIIIALAILLYVIHYNILSPILMLSKFADSITSDKPFNGKLSNGQKSYEINNLYNYLLSIKSYLAKEKSSNKELTKAKEELRIALDKTELMNDKISMINASLEGKVLSRTQELATALAIKTEFLNNVSHEVRTPIQGVTALSRGLVDHWQDFSDEKRLELAKSVANNAQRLFTLVSNLLDVSKFTANKMVFNLQQADLVQLIDEMIEECNSLYLIDKPQIKILFYPGELQTVLVLIDKDRIIQVLRNLFANAIKFTSKGTITVWLSKTEMQHIDSALVPAIKFTIEDEGVGIPASEAESVFEPFYQSSITKTKAGGTGLGLTIVREIITGHNGKIWVEGHDGVGAKISFVIPLIQESVKIDSSGQQNSTIIHRKPANILIIDDEESCLTSMEMLLYKQGYNLKTENDAWRALYYIEHNHQDIDLILLDLMMPDMYGLNLLAKLKANPELAAIPVILQSGISDDDEIKKAYDIGIVGFIKKPYQRANIISSLAQALLK